VKPPLTVAIVGSGPAGFYAAGALLSRDEFDVRVDMYERLPTPWGLVRFGVAPDHPQIKSVSSVFAKTASHDAFHFYGNVELGRDVTREELLDRYDAVLYAVGARADRSLGIPGEHLDGSVAAVDFVGWYNGHPDYADHEFNLQTKRAVVIGNGNVALDVARILCSPTERLATTDIADHALAALRHSSIEEVVVLGRRGPGQAAFTTLELRELPEFTESGVDVDPEQVLEAPDEATLPKLARRNLAVLRDYARSPAPRGARRMVLRFLRSPIELRGTDRVEDLVVGVNELRTTDDGRLMAADTGLREIIETGLVLRAVGYRGLPVAGLPFDNDRGVVTNDGGRVRDAEREYVTGWIKRGPTGIIGTNKKDAVETVATLLSDLSTGRLIRHSEGLRHAHADITAWLTDGRKDVVTEECWQRIDAFERDAGSIVGRPRVKLCQTSKLLAVAHGREIESQ